MSEQEFIKAHDAYADAIFRHCYFRVFDRERAKDIAQETFVRTWDYLASGKEIENIRAFLYRVANNLIIDSARERKALSLDVLREHGFDPPERRDGRLERQIEARRAVALLKRIGDGDRELVIMRYVDDLGPKEIAYALGVSENVVSVRLHRAMAKFRAILASSHGEGDPPIHR